MRVTRSEDGSDGSAGHDQHYYDTELSFLTNRSELSRESSSSPHSSLEAQASSQSSPRPLSPSRAGSPLLDTTLPGTISTLSSLLQVSQEISARLLEHLDRATTPDPKPESSPHSIAEQVADAPVLDVFSPIPPSASVTSLMDQFYTPIADSEHDRPGSITPRPPFPSSPSPSPRPSSEHLLDSSVQRRRVTCNTLGPDYVHIDDTTLASDMSELRISSPTSSSRSTPAKSPRSGYKSTLRRSPDPKKRPETMSSLGSEGSPSPQTSPRTSSEDEETASFVYISEAIDVSDRQRSPSLLSTILESEREYHPHLSPTSWSTYSESSFGHSPRRNC